MKVKYCRVSTEGQSAERQLLDKSEYDKIYSESVSGSIAMEKREIGSQLLIDIKVGKVKELVVEEVSRIGRDALDVMRTLRLCEDLGVNVVISNLGIQSITNGKRNDMFSMVSGIVLSLAENERRSIAERCLSGRIAARGRGVKFGRKEGVAESDTKFFSKPKVKEIVKDLKNAYPYLVIAKNRDCSVSLVQKVSDKLKAQRGEVKEKKAKELIAVNQIENDFVDEYDYVKPITWSTQNDKPTGMATWVDIKKKDS